MNAQGKCFTLHRVVKMNRVIILDEIYFEINRNLI